jgi:hypothetical protein
MTDGKILKHKVLYLKEIGSLDTTPLSRIEVTKDSTFKKSVLHSPAKVS